MKNGFFLFTLVSLLAGFAHGGPESSGGGAAAVCRGPDGKIISAHIIDLYEGRHRFEYQIVDSDAPAREQIVGVLPRLDRYQSNMVKENIAHVINVARFLPAGVGLAPTTDLGSEYAVLIPEGCRVEPVGVYEATGQLKVSRSVYGALSETDRAAFWVHEGMYRIARNKGKHTTSALARRATAALFAKNPSQYEREALVRELHGLTSQYSKGTDVLYLDKPASGFVFETIPTSNDTLYAVDFGFICNALNPALSSCPQSGGVLGFLAGPQRFVLHDITDADVLTFGIGTMQYGPGTFKGKMRMSTIEGQAIDYASLVNSGPYSPLINKFDILISREYVQIPPLPTF